MTDTERMKLSDSECRFIAESLLKVIMSDFEIMEKCMDSYREEAEQLRKENVNLKAIINKNITRM